MASSWETVSVDGSDMGVYTNKPEGNGPFPAVVVIQGGTGVEEFLRSFTDRLAGEGYFAAAPDLYHRTPETKDQDPSVLAASVDDSDVLADVNATAQWLRHLPQVDGERLGITGFCLGGRIVWLAAAATDHFKAAVPYYPWNTMITLGRGEQSPFALSDNIGCPVLAHFGELDENPSQEDMRKLDQELTRLGKPHEFHNYLGAPHGFMNHLSAERYHREAAETAWPRTVEFLGRHLKAAVPAS
jgi:carboxymethylenebutenolidase